VVPLKIAWGDKDRRNHARCIMAIDLTQPTLRPAQAARRIPPFRYRIDEAGELKPVRTHPGTVIRWIRDGVPLSDGSRLKLDAVRLPSGWVTSDDAIREFVQRITLDRSGGAVAVSTSMPAARRRAIEQVDRDLDRLGV
jgi:hypothetical protein